MIASPQTVTAPAVRERVQDRFVALSENRVTALVRSPLFVGVVFVATVVQVTADPLLAWINGVGEWNHFLARDAVVFLAALGCLVQALLVTQFSSYPVLSLLGAVATYLGVALLLDIPTWAAPMQLVVAVALFVLGAASSASVALALTLVASATVAGSMAWWAFDTGAPPEAVLSFVLTEMASFVTISFASASLGLLWAAHERRTRTADAQAREIENQQEETIQATRAAERGRIAQELHDVAGQHLAGLVSLCDASVELAPKHPQRALELIEDVRAEGRFAAASLYGALGDLRRVGDAETGHTPDLHDLPSLVKFWTERAMNLDATLHPGVGNLPAVVSTTAYRAAQEALSNVAKHAPGANVRLLLEVDTDNLSMTVANSAAVRELEFDSNFGLGWGLEGLRKKLSLVDGMLQAGPDGNGGWRLAVRIPLPELSGDTRE